MKLLLDENLSPKLAKSISDLFPGSNHVHDCGLGAMDDTVIWDYAKTNGFTIVSKDSDLHDRSLLYGSPPKLIWLRTGNCTTDYLEDLLRQFSEEIAGFDRDSVKSFLVLP
jgi:predicted nuclease of predicted toxin-antitoxin system